MRTKEQLKTLYNLSAGEVKKWGSSKPFISKWENNCTYTLYRLACEMSEVDSMHDAGILPAIFGEKGLGYIQAVALNEYWFWRIAHEYSTHCTIERDPVAALTRSISEIRNNNTRAFSPRKDALNGQLTPETACHLTAIGCLLWDFDRETWVPNPLFYSSREWAEAIACRPAFTVLGGAA
jgi:hypothetical protein